MVAKSPSKTIAALIALKALQEVAKRKGLDKMTLEETNAEIAAYRSESRLKRKPAKTPLDDSSRSRHKCHRFGLPDAGRSARYDRRACLARDIQVVCLRGRASSLQTTMTTAFSNVLKPPKQIFS
jgi:hypothetical protein